MRWIVSLLFVTTAVLGAAPTAAADTPLGCPDEYPWGASAGGATFCCTAPPGFTAACRVEPRP